MSDCFEIKTVRCSFCGASAAKPSRNVLEVCATCWTRITRNNRGKNISENEALVKAARCLIKSAKRHSVGKSILRCEALTAAENGQGRGYQCPNYADKIRRGRNVCFAHASSLDTNLQFVEPAEQDWISQTSDFALQLVDIFSRSEVARSALKQASDIIDALEASDPVSPPKYQTQNLCGKGAQ